MGAFKKTLVLCIFEWVRRERNSTISGTEGVMVEVEYSDQVHEAFDAAMHRRKILRNLPPFHEYFFVRYLTPLGSRFYQ